MAHLESETNSKEVVVKAEYASDETHPGHGLTATNVRGRKLTTIA